MKCAFFSCNGLGDGLVALTLSNNLKLNGYEIDTFHNSLGEMASWFNYLPILKYPTEEEVYLVLENYDRIFVSYNDSSKFVMKLIKEGKKKYKNKIYVINPCPSRKIGGQPFYEDAFLTPKLSVVDNLVNFAKNILKLKKIEKNILISPPENITFRKNISRIIIHPTSAKASKNWSSEKYIELAKDLTKEGFEPVFVVSEKEEKEWAGIRDKKIELKVFSEFHSLAFFVYESGYMIGNDSGIGHLASILNIPTLTIFRNHRTAALWRPGWAKSKTVYPNKLIPNLSFFRLRDKYWQRFISKRKVLKEFNKLII